MFSGQRSFDDLGTPLSDVTFCIIDLETTGGSADQHLITEIGAVKLRGGECLGTFQTLVNPGTAIPREITVITGITQQMVLPAPRIDDVFGSLMEFAGGTVIVGHNIAFDMRFLNAAATALGYEQLPHTTVDTLRLARRLLAGEVPNHKLGTLADRLRLDHRPSHRALDDALATGDLLHALLERAGSLGVCGLEDLLGLPKIGGHQQAAKLKLTNDLPRTPGVYTFLDRGGRTLYIGKATNLRSRVRSYFSTDTRRKVTQLLRETADLRHIECPGPLEPEVTELRLIAEHKPRFNRVGTTTGTYHYVKLTLPEPWPRLSVVRVPTDDGSLYLGPLSSKRVALRVVEALETVLPLRRCATSPAKLARLAGGGLVESGTPACTSAQLGVSVCPCSGGVDASDYAATVIRCVRAFDEYPDLVLEPLRAKMAQLGADQRFEEAVDVRDRAEALTAALRRRRRQRQLIEAGRIEIELEGRGRAVIEAGRLISSTAFGDQDRLPIPPAAAPESTRSDPAALAAVAADELHCIARWLDVNAAKVRLLSCDGTFVSAWPALPSFAPAKTGATSGAPEPKVRERRSRRSGPRRGATAA